MGYRVSLNRYINRKPNRNRCVVTLDGTGGSNTQTCGTADTINTTGDSAREPEGVECRRCKHRPACRHWFGCYAVIVPEPKGGSVASR